MKRGSRSLKPAAPAQGESTRAVHSGHQHRAPGEPVVSPIYPAATFYTEAEPSGEVRYTRYGTNPNHTILGDKIAALEGAEAALPLASGNAAMALALLSQVAAGDHIVAQRELYGGTLDLLNQEFPRLGIQISYVDGYGDAAAWRSALRDSTRVLLAECPVNPTLRIPDLRAIAAVAREHDLPLFVDATFGTPINLKPLQLGADLSIHSATKYFGGHSDLTAGVVAGRADLVEQVRAKLKTFGPVLDPQTAWLLERGVKTLALRMERHNRNGQIIAERLEQHPAIQRVFYPGLASHPDHQVAREILSGFGGMVSFVVRGGDAAALRVCARFQLLSVAPSLGGVESLVSMPRLTSHAALTREDRHSRGITDGFIRVSLGIEDAEDLWADLDQALQPELVQLEAAPLAG